VIDLMSRPLGDLRLAVVMLNGIVLLQPAAALAQPLATIAGDSQFDEQFITAGIP
jgi:hypothetical protein